MNRKIKAYLIITFTIILLIDELYILFKYWNSSKISILINHPIESIVIPFVCTFILYYLAIYKGGKQ